MLVVNGRGRAGKIINFIDLDIEWKCDVVAQQFEPAVVQKFVDVEAGASEKIINAKDIAFLKNEFACKYVIR